MAQQWSKYTAGAVSRQTTGGQDNGYAGSYEVIKTGPSSAKKSPKTPFVQPSVTPYDSFARSPYKGQKTHKRATGATTRATATLRAKDPTSTISSARTSPKVGTFLSSLLTHRRKGEVNADVDKAQMRSKTLLLTIVAISIIAVVLIVTLAIIIYFVAFGGENGVITAHALCQAKYGHCAAFRPEEGMGPYPNSCALIPCHYRCYYPGANLRWSDLNHKGSQIIDQVPGRDGLICASRSTCKNGVCKVTQSYPYYNKVNPKSIRKCIRETYEKSNSHCIDADICYERNYCKIKGQVRIGFSISKNLKKPNAFRCHSCRFTNLQNTTQWLSVRGCNRSSYGGCSYTCTRKNGTHDLPPGTPCRTLRDGYCWHGECVKEELFPTRTSYKELDLIDNTCYGLNNGTRCYKNSTGIDCVRSLWEDAYGKAVTRYGSSCLTWDANNSMKARNIPISYRNLGSTGCILYGKRIPWCYSTNPNVVWNYCYNLCPEGNIRKKEEMSIRVVTFSHSEYANEVLAMQAARHFSSLKADVVVINSWPPGDDTTDKRMRDLVNSLNSIPGPNWTLCGDGNTIKRSRLLIKTPLAGTGVVLKDTYHTVGCRVKRKNAPEFVVVGTNMHPNSKKNIDALPSECKCGKLFACISKSEIEEREALRLNDTIRLLQALTKDFRNDNVIIGGMFGQPSHLDWTEGTVNLHCNTTYQWTISAEMQDKGFTDSYRKIHSDPSFWPGITWSTLPVYRKTVQCRHDYQYFWGPNVEPINAYTYPAASPSNELKNSWPSNEYSVVVDYNIPEKT